MSALPYRQWLKLAAEKGYLLTEPDYEQLGIGQPYFIIEADYVGFRVAESNNPESSIWREKGFDLNRVYQPVDLLPYRETIVPLGGKRPNVCHRCMPVYPALLRPSAGSDNGGPYEIELYAECEPWLSSGNGDGYSRYMLWEDVLKMPNLYFEGYSDNPMGEPGEFVTGCDYLRR